MGAALLSSLSGAAPAPAGWTLPAPAPDRRNLTDREVELWVVPLPLPSTVEAALAATMSFDEWERAGRLIAPDKRRQFIGSRGVLRALLGAYLGVPPSEVTLTRQAHGKPALPAETGLRFNLSHTEGLLLVAVSAGLEVGVDVERVRPVEGASRLASRFFSVRERAGMEDGPVGFLRLWTCRESAVKAFGTGISAGWDDLRIVERSPDEADAVSQDRNCHVRLFSPRPGYVAALAALTDRFALRTPRVLEFSPV